MDKDYEEMKEELQKLNLTPKEYEQAIKELTERFDL